MSRVYDYPLVNWISIGLNKNKLKEVVDAIRSNRSIDDIMQVQQQSANAPYLNKIIREVVSKQFSEYMRPIVEIILNSIDARPLDVSEYYVSVRSARGKTVVEDNGEAMSLEEILKLLLIPFSTIKDENASRYVGRFGVGFFSSLNYCLQILNKEVINLVTSKGGESYESAFYASNSDVSSLHSVIRKIREREQGTRVKISREFHPYDLQKYIRDKVGNIPTLRAYIYVNRNLINSEGSRWYTSKIKQDNKGVDGRVGIRFSGDKHIYLDSFGGNVKKFDSPFHNGVRILLPPLVELTIGRDEFVRDNNYYAAAKSSFESLENLIRSLSRDDFQRLLSGFINLVPSLVSLLGLSRLEDVPNLNALINILIPNKRYALIENEYNNISPFLGRRLSDSSFSANPQSCSIWRQKYSSYQDLLNEMIPAKESYPYKDFINKIKFDKKFYPNLYLLFDAIENRFITDKTINNVKFVESEPCYEPFMFDEGSDDLYINIKHRYVLGGLNSLKVSTLISKYIRLPQIDRMLTKQNPKKQSYSSSYEDSIEPVLIRLSDKLAVL